MIITMQAEASQQETDSVVAMLEARGHEVHLIQAGGAPVIGINGRPVAADLGPSLEQMPGVAVVHATSKPYRLAARETRPSGTLVRVGNVTFGGTEPAIIAGPCAVESRDQVLRTANAVLQCGGKMLRGGAYKPRTSPYSFQGMGEQGLEILAEARQQTGLPVVTEVMEPGQVELVASYADMLQIGSRNMMNVPLLRRAAITQKPIMLKRGFASTIEEWLLAAEYILAEGNDQVILCERGIRSFDPATRFTLDLNAVPLVQQLSHLPVIVDPSHGTGVRELIPAMSMASIAAGAAGLILEIHHDPANALCDGPQAIDAATLSQIVANAGALSSLFKPAVELVA